MIIGFSGRAGAGKDTAGQVLTEAGWTKISFAEPMKRMLCQLFGWDMENWEDPVWKETPNIACMGKTPRYVAQTIGTDWGRDLIHENLWTTIAINRAKYLEAGGMDVVFTDVRFPNEVEAINEAGGHVINIVRSGDLRIAADHSSEQDLSEFVPTTINAHSGDLEGIRTSALHAVRILGGTVNRT